MEKNMEKVALAIFVVGTIMIIGSIWIYSKKDESAYQATLKIVNDNKAEISSVKALVNANIETIGKTNLRITELSEMFHKNLELCKDNDDSIKNLQVYCVKLKESQLENQEKISKLRPVIKVELVETPKTIDPKFKGLIKKVADEAKKLERTK